MPKERFAAKDGVMKKIKSTAAALLAITIITSVFSVTANAEDIDEKTDKIYNEEICTEVLSDNVQVSSRLLELLFGTKEQKNVVLCPGGDVFGVKIKQNGVTVTDAKGIPALKSGDIILSVNGKSVNTASEIREILEKSNGESVTVRAIHQGNEISLEVRPTLIDGEYRLGITLRDSAAGIGTVTFVDPETGIFGGLGHGICDSETGDIVSMQSGEVCDVVLGGVHKGESGKPGELCGILTSDKLGTLSKNCECGVFGTVDINKIDAGEAVAIGRRDEVTEGDATIISTIKNGKTAEYKVKIFEIDRTSTGSKSFKIKVTDPTLIAMTGGIVRGMSGSPIMQNGKLIGAVTHVMVADPTEGYGIFIENMLSAASENMQKAA